MLLANETVTVLNRYNDDWYYKTVKDASWFSRSPKSSISSIGPASLSADTATVIRIPSESAADYIDSRKWATLAPEARDAYWTLQPGDIIVRGPWEPTSSHPLPDTDCEQEYMTVGSVTDNRRAPLNPHIRIEG